MLASVYLMQGAAEINGEPVKTSDFLISEPGERLQIVSQDAADLFAIISPMEPGYRTYGRR
jgi:hypothetical protein